MPQQCTEFPRSCSAAAHELVNMCQRVPSQVEDDPTVNIDMVRGRQNRCTLSIACHLQHVVRVKKTYYMNHGTKRTFPKSETISTQTTNQTSDMKQRKTHVQRLLQLRKSP